jgi:hypothetical protein
MAVASPDLAQSDPPIVRALTAGGLYFLIAFVVGFVLGAVRELAIAPRIGSDLAILLETPVMAIVAWFAARFSIRRLSVPRGLAARLPMGVLALILLLGAEALLTQALRGGSLLDHWKTFGFLAMLANVIGLVWFALAPLLIRSTRPDGSATDV